MAKIIPLKSALENKSMRQEIMRSIREGMIIVYPTDTVYGLGCNAENAKAVARLREIKKAGHPLSVIAPSKRWIAENCVLTKPARQFLNKLPGKYTLILLKKHEAYLSAASAGKTIGVRIPGHPFTGLVQKTGFPFITTSANISGRPVVQNTGSIPFAQEIGMVIDGGRLGKKASKIIDFTGERALTVGRK